MVLIQWDNSLVPAVSFQTVMPKMHRNDNTYSLVQIKNNPIQGRLLLKNPLNA